MRNHTPKYLFLLLFSCLGTKGMALADVGQQDAIYQAALVQKAGSDASLQNSTTHAMKGLMDLAVQNRTGAIQNGHKAYGQFRNSESMDLMSIKNQYSYYKMHNQQLMNTKSASRLRPLPLLEDVDTDYSRLDPKFLREGEAGKVADEFEKRSGMKREVFLKAMSRAARGGISAKDPQLVDKVLSKFESFLGEIPNEEFRNGIKKTIDQVPVTARRGIVAKGVQKIAEIMAAMPADKNTNIALTIPSPDTERRPAAEPMAVAAAEPAPAAVEESAAEPKAMSGNLMVPAESGYRGLANEKFSGDLVGSVMQTALHEQQDETIFKQVSKRYRAMTPKLSLVGATPP